MLHVCYLLSHPEYKCELRVFLYKIFIITHGIAYKPSEGNLTLIIDAVYLML